MNSVRELRNKYRRRAVAVLGGGPSLPEDLERLPDGCVLIGVNHHAGRLVDVDYIVFADNPVKVPPLWDYTNLHVGRRLTHVPGHSDWDFSGVEFWEGGMSATFATWIACYMGAAPVILCGMDCFQGDKKYFYDIPINDHPCFTCPLENHLQAWRKCFHHCRHPETIRAMSGPLVEVFGAYDPAV